MKKLIAALRKVVANSTEKQIKDAAEGTDFDSPEGTKLLKENKDLLELLSEKELKVLFSGDYEQGSEGHYFDRDLVGQIKDFVKEAGKELGWDPESYGGDEDDTCPECGMDLEGYETCTNCDPESGQ